MKLSFVNYEEIKNEVAYLFTSFNVKTLPINPMELATKIGIELVPYSHISQRKLLLFKQISEDAFYFETEKYGEIIYYNDAIEHKRVNMTILHEIAHCILGHNDNMDNELCESEANFFAKYAIAPPPLIHQIKPTCAYDIENFFDISHEAASYAFRYYNVWLKNYYRKCACYNNYEKALLKLFENFFCKRCGSSYEVICL